MPVYSSSLIHIKDLGVQDYAVTWAAMKDFTDSRTDSSIDECWIVQHPPVFTLGQAGKPEHILQHTHIPVVHSDRGGQVTYHGPGQLVAYLLVDLKRKGLGVRDFVTFMEQVLIKLLAAYAIQAELKDGAPGVYVKGAKIASLGLRVRKGCTYHGLSLNVAMDLSPFQAINPCGYAGLAVTQMAECAAHVDFAKVQRDFINTLLEAFNAHSVE